ncbi:hypothetical protein ACFP1I_24430 [Dyadobacter subterraneus]|uniref:Lipoprotein n=1 Tax=Dyadobacter subterraneus TaxID=2773304 RepID=A0ABR9WLL1_9BACT|nr:hypothetical protein [Dyadobacter subterraneus]MBE9466403.1 hypothetical protein [Dyadobacter subterraneus]
MKRILLFFVTILLFSTCKKEYSVGDMKDPCTCYGDEVCTEQYVSLIIDLKDQYKDPIVLDEYYSTILETGEKINLQDVGLDSLRRKSGRYPIWEDKLMSLTGRCAKQIEFTGLREGREIVKKTFLIGHDCCHVKITLGDPNVIIPK